MNATRHRIEVINDFESGLFAEVVDAGDIQQIVEPKFIAAKLCDVTNIASTNRVSRLAAKFSLRLNLRTKRLAEWLDERGITHIDIEAVILSGVKDLALEGKWHSFGREFVMTLCKIPRFARDDTYLMRMRPPVSLPVRDSGL